mmetsp:Transcript_115302/g.264815  ORF Transcript_115302/g.264815 Transcript_115302/m.264815 type:complete len:201 (+) Transcript_115302:1420-2022(+)
MQLLVSTQDLAVDINLEHNIMSCLHDCHTPMPVLPLPRQQLIRQPQLGQSAIHSQEPFASNTLRANGAYGTQHSNCQHRKMSLRSWAPWRRASIHSRNQHEAQGKKDRYWPGDTESGGNYGRDTCTAITDHHRCEHLVGIFRLPHLPRTLTKNGAGTIFGKNHPKSVEQNKYRTDTLKSQRVLRAQAGPQSPRHYVGHSH